MAPCLTCRVPQYHHSIHALTKLPHTMCSLKQLKGRAASPTKGQRGCYWKKPSSQRRSPAAARVKLGKYFKSPQGKPTSVAGPHEIPIMLSCAGSCCCLTQSFSRTSHDCAAKGMPVLSTAHPTQLTWQCPSQEAHSREVLRQPPCSTASAGCQSSH